MNLYKKSAAFLLMLMIAGVLFNQSVSAQGYIDEDFLDNLHANAAGMLKEPNAAFNVATIPSKWDKESAVIIGYSRSVLFDRKSSGGFFTRRERSLYFFEKT